MINKDEKFILYLNTTVNKIFKVLPLYEEENIGVIQYIESLSLELESLEEIVDIAHYSEYVSLLATLRVVRKEIKRSDSKKSIVKREVFKSIDILKNLINKIQVGD